MSLCKVPECINTSHAMSLCDKHYKAWKKHGIHDDYAKSAYDIPAVDISEVGGWFEFKHGWKKKLAEVCGVSTTTVQYWHKSGMPQRQYDKAYRYAEKNGLLDTYGGSVRTEGEKLLAAIKINGSTAECEVRILRWID